MGGLKGTEAGVTRRRRRKTEEDGREQGPGRQIWCVLAPLRARVLHAALAGAAGDDHPQLGRRVRGRTGQEVRERDSADRAERADGARGRQQRPVGHGECPVPVISSRVCTPRPLPVSPSSPLTLLFPSRHAIVMYAVGFPTLIFAIRVYTC